MENYDEHLEHHGIKGMKWGIRRTPAQLGHREKLKEKKRLALSKDGRKNSVTNTTNKSIDKDMEVSKKVEKREAKKIERKAQKEIARREKILSDPTLLYKHRKEFSSEEIRKAMSNIQMEQNLQQLSLNQLSAGANYVNAALKYAEAGIKVYNNAAKVYNAFNKQNKKAPIIGQGKDKKKDKSKKDDDDD